MGSPPSIVLVELPVLGPGSPSEPGSSVPARHANAYMGGASTILGLVKRRGRPVEEDVDPPMGVFRGARGPAAAIVVRPEARAAAAARVPLPGITCTGGASPDIRIGD